LNLSLAFFFQAEDGIRDFHVTGVQTCALPIFAEMLGEPGHHPVPVVVEVCFGARPARTVSAGRVVDPHDLLTEAAEGVVHLPLRSEERRVGKEGSSRWAMDSGTKRSDR